MSSKNKLRNKACSDYSKEKKIAQGVESFKDKPVAKTLKKIEFASKVVEISDKGCRFRSISNSSQKNKHDERLENEKSLISLASSPLNGNLIFSKNFPVDGDNSKKLISVQTSKKANKIQQDLNSIPKKGNKHNKEKSILTEGRLPLRNKCKTSHNILKFTDDGRKNSLSVDKTRQKDLDYHKSKQKPAIKPDEKPKKTGNLPNKPDDFQSPTSQKSRNSIENLTVKLPEPSKKQKLDNTGKSKALEKGKIKSNRTKPKISPKVPNLKSKKYPEDFTPKLKQVVAKKPGTKPAKFESFRENTKTEDIYEHKHSGSKSSFSCSESAEWVNLDCDQFVQGPSDLVGDFLKKMNENSAKVEKKLAEEKNISKYSGSNSSESVNLVTEDKPPTKKNYKLVPPLQLMLLKNKKISDSSRYCEQDCVVYDSKDSLFKGLNSPDSKYSASKSARQVIRHKNQQIK